MAKKKVATIDCTPTWEGIVRIHIACLMNHKASPEAHESASKEIIRMAKLADERNVLTKQLNEVREQLRQAEDELRDLNNVDPEREP